MQGKDVRKPMQGQKSESAAREESGGSFAQEKKQEQRIQEKRVGSLLQEISAREPLQEYHIKEFVQKENGKQPVKKLQSAGKKAAGKVCAVAGGLKEEWLGATKKAKLIMSVVAAAAAVFLLLFIIQSVRLAQTVKSRKSAEAMSRSLQEEIAQMQGRLQEQEGQQSAGLDTNPAVTLTPEPITTAAGTPTPTMAATPTPRPPRRYLVCVDAGHGGSDGGAVLRRNGEEIRIESQDTLVIAKLFEKALAERGIEVRMTREDDTFLELEERTAIANEIQADLLISMHRNAYYDANGNTVDGVEGVEIWVHNSKPKNVTRLAEEMLAAMERVGITKNRGVKFGSMTDSNSNYTINRCAVMDSMIMELGFITSTADNRNFDEYSADYANALAEVVEAWLKEHIPLEE